MLIATALENINFKIAPVLRNSNLEPGTEGVVGQDEIPVLEDINVTITPVVEGVVIEVATTPEVVDVEVA